MPKGLLQNSSLLEPSCNRGRSTIVELPALRQPTYQPKILNYDSEMTGWPNCITPPLP